MAHKPDYVNMADEDGSPLDSSWASTYIDILASDVFETKPLRATSCIRALAIFANSKVQIHAYSK